MSENLWPARRYVVELEGCDDSTYCMFAMRDEEAAVLTRLVDEIARKSRMSCQPVMKVTPWPHASQYDRDKANEPGKDEESDDE